MKKIIPIFILIFVSQITVAQNQVKLFSNKAKSSIKYAANHPLHSWEGESKDVKAVMMMDEAKTKIESSAVSVNVSTFNSGNANRDSHMMEVTDAIKFPTITFSSTSISQSGNEITITGNLTFHGITKTITSKALMKKDKEVVIVSGSFIAKMTDFKIEPPSLMGMSTDDELQMTYTISF